MTPPTPRPLPLLLSAALAVCACADSGASPSSTGDATTATTTATTTAATTAAMLSTPREAAIGILRIAMTSHPEFRAVGTIWEPQAYDGMDSGYKKSPGHDDSGLSLIHI